MSDISRPYTKYDPEANERFKEGWERIFGKKKAKKKKRPDSSVGRATVL